MVEKNLEAVDLYFPVYNGIVLVCANAVQCAASTVALLGVIGPGDPAAEANAVWGRCWR